MKVLKSTLLILAILILLLILTILILLTFGDSCQKESNRDNSTEITTTEEQPKPAQSGQTKEKALKVTSGMTYLEVRKLMESHGTLVDSEDIVYKWKLTDGDYLIAWFEASENDLFVIRNEIASTGETFEPITPGQTKENALRIKIGMTHLDVCHIMNDLGDLVAAEDVIYKWWLEDGGNLIVWFEANGSYLIVKKAEIDPTGEKYPPSVPTKEQALKIKPYMTYKEIVEIMGESGRALSAGDVYSWDLSDGGRLSVLFYPEQETNFDSLELSFIGWIAREAFIYEDNGNSIELFDVN